MSKADKTDKALTKPMDDSVREQATGAPVVNNQRVCGAIKTLVAEMNALFPETTVEYSNYDGRNTALAVTFDLTPLDGGDSVIFNNLLSILDTDERVAEVITADYDQSFVAMKSSARTQDRRETFGIAVAYSILTDDEDDSTEDDSLDEPEYGVFSMHAGSPLDQSQWGSL